MADFKTIRLRYSLRSGKEILPSNAVVDAEPTVADELINNKLADETDALERYPNMALLTIVHECPVQGEGPAPAKVIKAADHDAPTDVFGNKLVAGVPRTAPTTTPTPVPQSAPAPARGLAPEFDAAPPDLGQVADEDDDGGEFRV